MVLILALKVHHHAVSEPIVNLDAGGRVRGRAIERRYFNQWRVRRDPNGASERQRSTRCADASVPSGRDDSMPTGGFNAAAVVLYSHTWESGRLNRSAIAFERREKTPATPRRSW